MSPELIAEIVTALDNARNSSEALGLISQLAVQKLGYTRAALSLVEEDSLRLAAVRFADDPESAAQVQARRSGLLLGSVGLLEEWRTGDGAAVVCDSGPQAFSGCTDWLGLPECVVAPLLSSKQLLGVLLVGPCDGAAPPDAGARLSDLALYTRIAAQVLDKHRFRAQSYRYLEQTRRRIAELAVHQQIGEAFHAATSVEQVLDVLIEEVRIILSYDCAVAAIFDDYTKRWVIGSRGAGGESIEGILEIMERITHNAPASVPASVAGTPDALPEQLLPLKEMECQSYMCVPLRVHDESQGILVLGSRRERAFTRGDLRFVTAVADSAAIHSLALRTEERLRRAVDQIGEALSSGLDLEQTLQVIVEIAASLTRASAAAFLVLDPEEPRLVVRAQCGLSSDRGIAVPADGSFSGRVVREASSLMLNDLEGTGLSTVRLECGAGARAALGVPVTVDSSIRGALVVYSLTRNAFKPSDMDVLNWFAGHVALALRNAEAFNRERNIAAIFQASLLMESSPRISGYTLGTKYQAAFEEASVGGDFFDFVELDDGRVVVVVGDVAGKGLRAAVYTAMAKYMLRAYAAESTSPARMIGRLNDALCRYIREPGTFITLFCGVLDPASHTLVYTSAGHEPALFGYPDSRVLELAAGHGPALGIIPGADYAESKLAIEPGCCLFVYTDGASEAASDGKQLGTAGLAGIVSRFVHLNAPAIVDRAYHGITDYTGRRLRDDVVLLVVKRS